ncbi:hypothetical protein [Lactobacillus sp. PV034]|uniref:hypothetical protein n=1 Tax=Lactobacillus sp. PV034 TaxID=2594495 RepID=UPI00223EBC73|nr:hypothetical protein [Lactobacillus sp. PV034]QNQ80977.1 hypothetical protein FP432_05125 [Lactobacillus sp. PV034]
MSDDFDRRIKSFFKNYHDRGMVKWAGFYLSDHTAKINADYQRRTKKIRPRPAMPLSVISEQLLQAFVSHQKVKIQLKIKNIEAQYEPDIEGRVEGYNEDEIIVSGQRIKITEINNILL